MTKGNSTLIELIESTKTIVIAELTPPATGDAARVKETAKRFEGKVHALGLSDNRDGVRMSALAAASLVLSEKMTPIVHMVTRDRNRIALQSDCLGAEAMGIRNLLLTSGTHQVLGNEKAAKNVYDLDPIQLLQILDDRFCLGAVASPYADPMPMQIVRAQKKIAAGARFLITDPVFDLERFKTWWDEIKKRGLHENAAILAGVEALIDQETAESYAKKRPSPGIPEDLVKRIASRQDKDEQRSEGVKAAVETIERLSELEGLRGFEIRAGSDPDAAIEIIEQSGLRID